MHRSLRYLSFSDTSLLAGKNHGTTRQKHSLVKLVLYSLHRRPGSSITSLLTSRHLIRILSKEVTSHKQRALAAHITCCNVLWWSTLEMHLTSWSSQELQRWRPPTVSPDDYGNTRRAEVSESSNKVDPPTDQSFIIVLTSPTQTEFSLPRHARIVEIASVTHSTLLNSVWYCFSFQKHRNCDDKTSKMTRNERYWNLRNCQLFLIFDIFAAVTQRHRVIDYFHSFSQFWSM